MAQDVGTGATITFATTSFSADLLSVNGTETRDAIETTHLGTTTARTFMAGDLYDPGTLEVEMAYDSDVQPPIRNAAEVITVTFPIPAGLTNGATAAATGFVTSWNWTVPLEDRITSSATIKLTGAVTWTDAS